MCVVEEKQHGSFFDVARSVFPAFRCTFKASSYHQMVKVMSKAGESCTGGSALADVNQGLKLFACCRWDPWDVGRSR